MAPLDALVHSERANALIGWSVTGVLALLALWSVGTGAVLRGGLTLLVVGVTALPALSTRDWTAMVPWPLPLVAALAVAAQAAGFYPEIASYVALATFALVAVVDVDVFTSVDLSRRFAVGFAVMSTMATQGLWAVAQFYSDRWLGTEYLTTQTELQWDFVAVTVVAVAVGGLFELYVERFEHVGSHRRPPTHLEST